MLAENYNKDRFLGFLIRGELIEALAYLKQFPDLRELYERYMELFEHGAELREGLPDELAEMLLIYRLYYREVFFDKTSPDAAEENMRRRFLACFGLEDEGREFCEIEEGEIAAAFAAHGYSFLGGLTGGLRGPYIWKSTREHTYNVELPNGTRPFSVRFLDGFISQSWLHYISLGEIGTGGWTSADGIINCIEASYNTESENFNVSLLKHEAQHSFDMENFPDMLSAELEYRAKLVELIYSTERKLLPGFILEAGDGSSDAPHAAASQRLMRGFISKLGCRAAELEALPIYEVQRIARLLFDESRPTA